MRSFSFDEYVGRAIKRRRRELGLNQKQLGQRLRISTQQMSKYERGQNRLTAARLWQFSQELHIPFHYFFREYEESLIPEDIAA